LTKNEGVSNNRAVEVEEAKFLVTELIHEIFLSNVKYDMFRQIIQMVIKTVIQNNTKFRGAKIINLRTMRQEVGSGVY